MVGLITSMHGFKFIAWQLRMHSYSTAGNQVGIYTARLYWNGWVLRGTPMGAVWILINHLMHMNDIHTLMCFGVVIKNNKKLFSISWVLMFWQLRVNPYSGFLVGQSQDCLVSLKQNMVKCSCYMKPYGSKSKIKNRKWKKKMGGLFNITTTSPKGQWSKLLANSMVLFEKLCMCLFNISRIFAFSKHSVA